MKTWFCWQWNGTIDEKVTQRASCPKVDINVFNGDPAKHHYFLAVFEEVVEKSCKISKSLLEQKYENLLSIVAAP